MQFNEILGFMNYFTFLNMHPLKVMYFSEFRNSERSPNGKPDLTNFHVATAYPWTIPVMSKLILILGSSRVAMVVPKVRNVLKLVPF